MKDANVQNAIAALATSRTLSEAARTAKLDRRTLYRYLQNSDFLDAVKQMRIAAAWERAEHLTMLQSQAIDTLTDLMHDTSQPAAVRVTAAKTVLSAATEARESVDSIVHSCEFESKWF